MPETMRDGREWPRISIVTPSYNQDHFLEETMRSVLLQGYPNLEYIIMDGGSTDGSIEIIQRYEPWLFYWVSERDEGQGDAINNGFVRSTGDVLAWFNSDDTYEPGVLFAVAGCFARNPGAQLVYGDLKLTNAQSEVIDELRSVPATLKALIHDGCNLGQPAAFWTREAFLKYGPLSTRLKYAMEYELFYRILRHHKAAYLRQHIASLRIHSQTKTSLGGMERLQEKREILQSYGVTDGWSRHAWRWVYRMRRYFFYLRQGDLGYMVQRAARKLRDNGSARR
jgi:glycosyltransferase involved in cell wall biosynthesis